MEWMLLPLQRYAEFSGRSRRREYWSFMLLSLMVVGFAAVLMLGGGLLSAIEQRDSGFVMPDSLLFWLGAVILGFWWLGTIIPNLALTVRRFHDCGLSGWAYVGLTVLSAIPYIGLLASLAYLAVLFLPGTPGINKWGENPKYPGEHYAYAFE